MSYEPRPDAAFHPPSRVLDQFDDASVPLAESRVCRAAFDTHERPRVLAFRFSHGQYHLTVRLGTASQGLSDPNLITLLTRARRLLDLGVTPIADSQEAA